MNITGTLLAFLAALPMAVDRAPATVPVFTKRPWHSRNHLDIRPVLWSLRNRPQDWNIGSGHYTIDHTPSQHEFWIANGFFFYGLYNANGCSCNHGGEGSFSLIQKFQFGSALRAWRRSQQSAVQERRDQVNAQFSSHFIPKKGAEP